METLFLRVVWLSATVSAVLLPLLLASRWLQSRVKAKSLYILWLLLAVRLVVPVEITLPKPAVTVQVPQYEVTIPTNRPSGELPDDQLSPVEPNVAPSLPQMEQEPDLTAQTEVPVAVVLGTLWLTGVFAIALIQISSYLVTRRALLRWARPVSPETREQIQYLALRLGLKRTFQVRRSDRVRTAMVLGVLRPVLLLPQEECDPLVVLHELNHLRRRDLEYKGLMMAACWLHWFNPLVWWMSRVAGRNLELCCDEDVAGKENSAFRHRYGRLLLECATEGAGPVLSSRFGSSKEELKARLTNLFVAKKRGRALVCLALACAVLTGGLVACEQTQPPAPDAQLDALEESISYQDGVLSFTLPEGEGEWNIQISGRADTSDLGGISLHYMEGTEWTPSMIYFLPLSAQTVLDVTELTLTAWLDGQERSVDLVPYLRERIWYVNEEYGFTLQLPQEWVGQVDIREESIGVDFCMKDAGDWEGAGWLVGVYLTDLDTWQSIADADYPYGQRFLGQTAQGILYAIGPSDVRYDETIPGEMERYNALYAQVDEMLGSFQVKNTGEDGQTE
ncbi:MAG: M56 family metallopeptidase [Flintibacter sp.]|uniref:M56 family metallopeptidase n=1 Tax=Flintibacter sp. TaxID=1918624 RepID=UPI0026716B71|nr:M56 family metallopeptidase [Flintibacter sp.]MCI6150173.1 M56 family metallopeptidase [Flintibacter sp.]MCI7659522.1 M56 family metallopeptidase [Flintibacter sp.]MDY5037916.1 M56 family metallopeptidase [Lawsonibacter sp.]